MVKDLNPAYFENVTSIERPDLFGDKRAFEVETIQVNGVASCQYLDFEYETEITDSDLRFINICVELGNPYVEFLQEFSETYDDVPSTNSDSDLAYKWSFLFNDEPPLEIYRLGIALEVAAEKTDAENQHQIPDPIFSLDMDRDDAYFEFQGLSWWPSIDKSPSHNAQVSVKDRGVRFEIRLVSPGVKWLIQMNLSPDEAHQIGNLFQLAASDKHEAQTIAKSDEEINSVSGAEESRSGLSWLNQLR